MLANQRGYGLTEQENCFLHRGPGGGDRQKKTTLELQRILDFGDECQWFAMSGQRLQDGHGRAVSGKAQRDQLRVPLLR